MAMQEEVGLPFEMIDATEIHTCCPNLFGGVGTFRQHKTKKETIGWCMKTMRCEPQTFTQYLCSKEQTVAFDDLEKVISIQKDLFKRMLVYVYCANNGSQCDATDIIAKLSKIDFELNQIAVTKKDWYHRLLPYIPWTGQRDHGSCYPLMIQDKVVFLHMDFGSCIHKQTNIQPCNQHVRLASPLTDSHEITQEFNKLVALTKIG